MANRKKKKDDFKITWTEEGRTKLLAVDTKDDILVDLRDKAAGYMALSNQLPPAEAVTIVVLDGRYQVKARVSVDRKRLTVLDVQKIPDEPMPYVGVSDAPVDEHGCLLEKGYEPSVGFAICMAVIALAILFLGPVLLSNPRDEVPPYVVHTFPVFYQVTKPIPHVRQKGDPKWLIWDSQIVRQERELVLMWSDGHLTWRPAD